jgi:prevent-host-death family protein
MRFAIVLAPEAIEDLKRLKANARATVIAALEKHLRHEPGKTSRSRIKRLRGLRRPQYRLRIGDIRVFYDTSGSTVEVLAIVAKPEADFMADPVRKSRMKEVPLSEAKDDFSHLLREAAMQDIVITRHGKPAGVLIGFESEDDWFDYRLENDQRFQRRIDRARESLRAGRGVALENVKRLRGRRRP